MKFHHGHAHLAVSIVLAAVFTGLLYILWRLPLPVAAQISALFPVVGYTFKELRDFEKPQGKPKNHLRDLPKKWRDFDWRGWLWPVLGMVALAGLTAL